MQTTKEAMRGKTVRLPVALLDEAARVARKERRSLSDVMRFALEDWLKKMSRRRAA